MFETTGKLETSQGRVAYGMAGKGPLVVFLHGNSSCKEIFEKQFTPELTAKYCLVACDLPGHGQSDDAPMPESGYTIKGFAQVLIEALAQLNPRQIILVGWSLGGHIALEMLGRWPDVTAVWITGTPPIDGGMEDMIAAFRPSEHMELTFKPDFTAAEAEAYTRATLGETVALEAWMSEAAQRADGRFRPVIQSSALGGVNMDERRIVRETEKPVAVVVGEHEPFVNNGFLQELSYGHLWEDKVHVLPGLAHMPFWEAPEAVNSLLESFLDYATAENERADIGG